MTKRKEPGLPHGNQTHGGSRTPEWYAWECMKQRCYNPKDRGFINYGGRGIFVCERWLHSFENFLLDMGLRPIGYAIERRDNNGPYSPDNCLWIPRGDQNKNKRNVRFLTFADQTLSISDWARKLQVPVLFIWSRLKRGWSIEDTLTRPRTTLSEAGQRGAASRWKK